MKKYLWIVMLCFLSGTTWASQGRCLGHIVIVEDRSPSMIQYNYMTEVFLKKLKSHPQITSYIEHIAFDEKVIYDEIGVQEFKGFCKTCKTYAQEALSLAHKKIKKEGNYALVVFISDGKFPGVLVKENTNPLLVFSPGFVMSKYSEKMLFDGRIHFPIENPNEMASRIFTDITAGYSQIFTEGEPLINFLKDVSTCEISL